MFEGSLLQECIVDDIRKDVGSFQENWDYNNEFQAKFKLTAWKDTQHRGKV